MKLHLLLFSLIVFCPLMAAQAQTSGEQQQRATTIPPVFEPQPDETWQIFAPDLEEFALVAPAAFTPRFINSDADGRQPTPYRSYGLLLNGNYYFIFSDQLKEPWQYKTVFDIAGKMADRDRQGAVFMFQDAEGFYHRILSFKTASRVYTFQTVSPAEKSPSLDRFFAGIKIGDQNPVISNEVASGTSQNSATVIEKNETPKTNSETSRRGMGSGSGIGSGSGSGNSSGATAGSPQVQSTGLKILSKPRPSYTDAARFYGITGVIKLRVTFSANGTIGSVDAFSKLPFGLTDSAIAAARQIKFEPQTRDNQPTTVSKIIEYSFSIY